MESEQARINITVELELQQKIKKAAKANRMTIGAYCLTMIEIGMQAVDSDRTKSISVKRHLLNNDLIG